jgi:hypothetical protein
VLSGDGGDTLSVPGSASTPACVSAPALVSAPASALGDVLSAVAARFASRRSR